MSMNYLAEAFKELKLLDEGRTFNFDEKGAEELANFLEDDVLDDYETIIDPEATSEEELKPTYVGNVILGCETCHSMIYKAPEDVVVDEETQLANVGELCPYCFTTDGFKLVGKVAPFEDVTVETDGKVSVSVDDQTIDLEKVEEAFSNDNGVKAWTNRDIELFTKAAKELGLTDFDMKLQGYGDNEKVLITAIKDGKKLVREESSHRLTYNMKDLDDAKDFIMFQFPELDNQLTESMDDISITTDNEVIKIKSTPRADKEEIAPLSEPEVEDIVNGFEDDGVDVPEIEDEMEIEEIDEEGFDNLGESYLKRVYENVESYKTVAGRRSNGKIILEGVIKFNSGKKAKTSFVFESRELTKRGKLRLFGENVNIAANKGAFILTGRNEGKKLICEAFTYNYNAKDAKGGASKKLYGTVRR